MKRRIASSLLALCMLLSLLPTMALAGESAAQASPATEVRTAQELEAAVSGGGAVRLMADIDLTGSLFITTDVTLDLNGKVLRGDGSGSVIRIEIATQLVLEDSSSETVHKFDTSQPLWTLAAEDASGEHITEVKGGVITGGKARYGGGIYVSDKAGTSLAGLTMNGGNIVGCAANGSVSNDGGVYAHYSVFRMTGGSIRGCTTNEKSNLTRTAGAGVYMSGGGNAGFTMTGGTISNCKAGSTTGGDARTTPPTLIPRSSPRQWRRSSPRSCCSAPPTSAATWPPGALPACTRVCALTAPTWTLICLSTRAS